MGVPLVISSISRNIFQTPIWENKNGNQTTNQAIGSCSATPFPCCGKSMELRSAPLWSLPTKAQTNIPSMYPMEEMGFTSDT